MMFLNKKNLFLIAVLVLAISIPITINLTQKNQESRSRASASTTLSFNPTSSTGNPLQKNSGDAVPLDVMVNPGNNSVTFIKFQVTYDASKLELDDSNPFTLNSDAFPTKVEGPVVSNGTIAEAVSIGSDPTKVIQKVTKVGTLNFKAIGGTGGTPTTVAFGSGTQALSSGSNDQASENVISTTSPASIMIAGGTTTTLTPTSSSSPSPSAGPTATAGATLTPLPTASSTILDVDIKLHGLGSAGDNPNPDGSLSNKNPLHPQRNLDVTIFDTTNNLIASFSGSIIYDNPSGDFLGKFDLGPTFKTGNYSIKIKTDSFLRRLVAGIQPIENLRENSLAVTALVTGDVNNDNALNVLDYNAMLDCGYGAVNPLPMADPNSLFNEQACQIHTPATSVDVDDNGIINSADYNLFLRELSVQNGD